MYFLVSLALTIIFFVIWLIFKNKKKLHLEILPITFGAATLMWLVDCIFSLKEEGVFLSFDLKNDLYISLLSFALGILLWVVLSFILNYKKNNELKKENIN